MRQTTEAATVAARDAYAGGYYKGKLEEGLEFQDFVTEALYAAGIVLVGYASRRYQIERGENLLGAEIKRDGKFRTTGNLYIEMAEKSQPDRPHYTPSGIMRGDNSWLFIIGDEQTIFIFSTKFLQQLAASGRYRDRELATPTSQGFLLPLADADKYCIRRIERKAARTGRADDGADRGAMSAGTNSGRGIVEVKQAW